jgi:hypothetical protein
LPISIGEGPLFQRPFFIKSSRAGFLKSRCSRFQYVPYCRLSREYM